MAPEHKQQYLSTNPTGVGLDPGVKPHVPRQHVGPREGPVAEVAHVRESTPAVRRSRLVPGGHVLGQPVGDAEDLAADGADEDDVGGRERRRSGRFGDVGGELAPVQRVPVVVTPVAAQTSGPATEIRRPGPTATSA